MSAKLNTQFDLNDDLGFDDLLNPQLKKKEEPPKQKTETKPKQEEKKKGGSNLILYVVIILLVVCVVSLIIWIFKRKRDTDEVAEQALKEKDEIITKLKEQEKLLTKANSSYKSENQQLKAQITDLKHQSTLYEEKTKELTNLYNQTLQNTKEMNEKETFSRIKNKRQVAVSSEDESESEDVKQNVDKQNVETEVKPTENTTAKVTTKNKSQKTETKVKQNVEPKVKQKTQKKSHQINPLIDNDEGSESDDQQTLTDINGILN